MSRHQLKQKIVALLESSDYQPLDKVDISKKLQLPPDDRRALRTALHELEREGHIARIRKDRYIIPDAANLVTGIIRFRQSGSAWIESERRNQPELSVSAENTWTAMHGDRVVARVMHEGVQQGRLSTARGPEGRVIRILERANKTVVGTLQRSKQFFYIVPDDPRLVHDIYVRPEQSDALPTPQIGDKVVARLELWESRHVNPEGKIIEVLGPASRPGVDMLSIIRKYNYRTEFPAPALREADKVHERVQERELEARQDLREQMIVTIDPDDAKDFDDAILVEKHAHGWSLGVHIADVSNYVRPGSALDREAMLRGNSVYLVDRVIPMLPEKLSNGICSLRPDEDRLAHSVFIDFSHNGKIKSARFARTVIRSAARLTYKQAFALLQQPDGSALSQRLQTAWDLASLLRKNRFRAGSLDLDFPEVKVWLDNEGRPARIEKVENDISHQLIEEFMLAANEVVAREIRHRQIPSIYRIHEKPEPDRLAEFRELAISYGYKIGDLTNRNEVQRLLALIRGKAEEHALKLAFLKSLKRATYDVSPIGHYGLAKANYTHFTSPIRRYADLVVHRVLESTHARNLARAGKVCPTNLDSAAQHISETERVAADGERDSVKLKKLEFFQQQLRSRHPENFAAIVIDVRSYGLLVELPDYVLTGLIHVSSLGDDFYQFDPVRLRFIGRRHGREYGIGDRLEVIVARVDVFKKQIDFHPVQDSSRGKKSRRR